jgi:hypothetical protein
MYFLTIVFLVVMVFLLGISAWLFYINAKLMILYFTGNLSDKFFCCCCCCHDDAMLSDATENRHHS